MRGEEQAGAEYNAVATELPPHARRRGAKKESLLSILGITSACAEKSCVGTPRVACARNYLRMRGEEVHFLVVTGAC